MLTGVRWLLTVNEWYSQIVAALGLVFDQSATSTFTTPAAREGTF